MTQAGMKSMRRLAAVTALTAGLMACEARANTAFIVSAANLQDQNGGLAPTSGLVLLVVDTVGSGFTTNVLPTSSLNVGSFLAGSGMPTNNLIVGAWDLSSLNTPGQLLNLATVAYNPPLAANEAMALYWFPSLTLASATPGPGTFFGYYTDPIGVDGSAGWSLPGEGSPQPIALAHLNFYTVSRGGTNVDTTGRASFVTLVPPAAGFIGNPTIGVEPLLVTFTDISTGNITNHFWDFGDATTTNTATTTVTHNYSAGTYSVKLVASGPAGISTNLRVNYITVVGSAYNAWEGQYFGPGNPPSGAPGVDADGTGQNNAFKYVAGLDPTNPASVFLLNVASVPNQPSSQSLAFTPMATGRIYTPQFNTDLVNGVWLPLATYTGPTTNGNQITVTDTNALSPQEFYRIDISLP